MSAITAALEAESGKQEAGKRAGVSNAFNRPEKLSPEVRENILAVAKRMNYSEPHPAAKSLRSAGAFGLVIHDELRYALDDPAVTQMMRHI
ncbi:hypothetical protein [Pararhizobium sp.]|uniref:hypothetical protein n=1 Tax=Pararhizobium sp. TaxID=1977563 RepID=UPI002726951D|nr:hypothetical protein [Pararhizobium sp.]MDO9418645.1 hypothetical protein [Pararhizobium sp.]